MCSTCVKRGWNRIDLLLLVVAVLVLMVGGVGVGDEGVVGGGFGGCIAGVAGGVGYVLASVSLLLVVSWWLVAVVGVGYC